MNQIARNGDIFYHGSQREKEFMVVQEEGTEQQQRRVVTVAEILQ